MVPVAVHGASRSIASNGGASNVSASATTISAVKAQALEIGGKPLEPFRRTIDRRYLAPAAASSAAFPPGAAQRSTIRMPGRGWSSRAGSAAAASCTHHSPSA